MPSGEFERKLNSCIDCPIKEGRFCTAYKNGISRLVYDLLAEPEGMRQYGEPREILESIEDCLRKLKVGGMKQGNAEREKQLV